MNWLHYYAVTWLLNRKPDDTRRLAQCTALIAQQESQNFCTCSFSNVFTVRLQKINIIAVPFARHVIVLCAHDAPAHSQRLLEQSVAFAFQFVVLVHASAARHSSPSAFV